MLGQKVSQRMHYIHEFDRIQKLETEEKNIFLERLKAEQARDLSET